MQSRQLSVGEKMAFNCTPIWRTEAAVAQPAWPDGFRTLVLKSKGLHGGSIFWGFHRVKIPIFNP
jgi:hypothetical protein